MLSHRLIGYYENLVPWSVRAYVAPRIMGSVQGFVDNISLDFRLKRFLAGRGVPLLSRHQRWLGSFVDEEKSQLMQGWDETRCKRADITNPTNMHVSAMLRNH